MFPIFNKSSFNKTKFNIPTITSSNQQYNETNKSQILQGIQSNSDTKINVDNQNIIIVVNQQKSDTQTIIELAKSIIISTTQNRSDTQNYIELNKQENATALQQYSETLSLGETGKTIDVLITQARSDIEDHIELAKEQILFANSIESDIQNCVETKSQIIATLIDINDIQNNIEIYKLQIIEVISNESDIFGDIENRNQTTIVNQTKLDIQTNIEINHNQVVEVAQNKLDVANFIDNRNQFIAIIHEEDDLFGYQEELNQPIIISDNVSDILLGSENRINNIEILINNIDILNTINNYIQIIRIISICNDNVINIEDKIQIIEVQQIEEDIYELFADILNQNILISQFEEDNQNYIENLFEIFNILQSLYQEEIITENINIYINKTEILIINENNITQNITVNINYNIQIIFKDNLIKYINIYCGNIGIDPYTVLLLHMNGVNNTNIFIDEAGNNVTAYGNAHIDTDQKVFGESSGSFDGIADYLTLPTSGDFNFGINDFTIDCWLYINSFPQNCFIFGGVLTGDFYITFGEWGSFIGIGKVGSWSSSYYVEDQPFTIGSWQHLTISRDSGIIRFFHNGIKFAERSVNFNYSITSPVHIGNAWSGSSYSMDAYIDEFRVSKGIARWTEDFTPPDFPYFTYIPDDKIICNELNIIQNIIINQVESDNYIKYIHDESNLNQTIKVFFDKTETFIQFGVHIEINKNQIILINGNEYDKIIRNESVIQNILIDLNSDINIIFNEINNIQLIKIIIIPQKINYIQLSGIITSYTQINGVITVFNDETTLDIVLKGYINEINLKGIMNSDIELKGFIEEISLKGVMK